VHAGSRDCVMSMQREGTKGKDGHESPAKKARSTRLAATVILLVAAPLLLLSSLALALFYVAPTRFGNFLSRLPGEVAIRTVLFFAPVTLLAIVVLAVLYAFEKPVIEITRPRLIPVPEPKPKRAALSAGPALFRFAWWSLWLSIPILLASIAVRAAAFLSPSKFDSFLKRFPAESTMSVAVEAGPFLLILLVALELVALFTSRGTIPEGDQKGIPRMKRWLYRIGPARLAVGAVFIFTLPLLLASLLALLAFFSRPERTLDILTGLPKEVVLRMGLIFAPASLFVVVILAVLFLLQRSYSLQMDPAGQADITPESFTGWQVWAWYGSWLLAGGVATANSAIFGLVVGMVVLLLR
jgi:hypothetical protein